MDIDYTKLSAEELLELDDGILDELERRMDAEEAEMEEAERCKALLDSIFSSPEKI